MCRIFGVSFGEEAEAMEPWEMAEIVFPLMVARGPDAYGWMASDGKSIAYQKWPGRSDAPIALDNICYSLVDAHLGYADECRWFVGHTRWATSGPPSYNGNNHPLAVGNIVGVHNGKVDNAAAILSEIGRVDSRASVDSEAIFAAVNLHGPFRGMQLVQGPTVAVFSSTQWANTLRIARTAGRQLYIGRTVKGSLVWATDEDVLLRLRPAIRFAQVRKFPAYTLATVRSGNVIRHTSIPTAQSAKPLSADAYLAMLESQLA